MMQANPAVPAVAPETELEKARYDAALRRRQLSLILAKKLSPTRRQNLKPFLIINFFS